MKHNNIVSIIIPCYNNGRYLVKMIECFRRQTSSNWEMVIVDDGSTDNTPQIIRESIADLPNVLFIERQRQPKGSVVCRNIGFEKSSGKYICHLDADDLVSPTFVEHRVAYMDAHPEVDYATFIAKSFTDENFLPTMDSPGDIWGKPKGDKPLLYYFLSVNYPFSVWNNIYKKESIKKLPWDEKVLMFTDFSFIVPGILAGLKHSFSDKTEIDYYYRHDVGNKVAMTANPVSPEKCNSTLYLLEKTQEGLKKHGLYKEYNEFFFNFFLFYFKNLILRKSTSSLPDFYRVTEKYYSRSKVTRLRIIEKSTAVCKCDKMVTVVYYLMGAILFGKKNYLQLLKKLIIRIK